MEEERIEFVQRVLRKEKSKAELCREYGISCPTGNKWLKRYLNGEEMSDRSRRPFHTPNKISLRLLFNFVNDMLICGWRGIKE